MKKSLEIFTRGAAVATIAFSLSAHAQEAAPPAPAEEAAAPEVPDESVIIVTATRRASPLSNVPIAVSAVTAASLQNSGANDIRQLNQLAPSLLVSSTGSEANGSARIRGVGTVGDNPGLESSVAVFIDGVYRSRTGAGLTDLGEIERIEVLRGPQGTLFGRNASAGLINIVSKGPEFTFGAKGEITYGNYDFWRVSGSVTGPVSEKIALRMDGVWSQRDGFMKLVDAAGNKTGDANDRDRYFLRGQALIEPNDALSIRLIGDYTNRDESCCAAVYISTREVADPTPGVAGDATASPFNRIVRVLNGIKPGSVPTTPNPYSRTAYTSPNRPYVSKLKDWGLSGEINYDFGDAKLTSITAYRDYKSNDYGDYDYSAADILYRDPNTYRQFKTFTQELRLQGEAFEGKLDWLVGGYLANEKLTLEDNIVFGADYGRFATCRILTGNLTATSTPLNLSNFPYAACGSSAGLAPLIAGTGALAGAFTALTNIPSGTGDVHSRYFQKSKNWALFTHNIVHITDTLDFTGGLRYTHESKDFSASFNNNNVICPSLQTALAPALTNPASAAAARGILTFACLGNSSAGIPGVPGLNNLALRDKISDGEFSGTAVLSFKPSRETLLYASYSRGYKAGGYNLDRFELGNTGLSPLTSSPFPYFSPRSNADAPSLRFAAEKVDSFEVGMKYAARQWNVSIAAFRQEFKDFQLNTFNGTGFVVQNINGCSTALTAGRTCAKKDVKPGLISQGVEVELSASPIRNVRVSGGLTYAKAKFAKRLVGSSDGQTPLDTALFLLPGNLNSNAPEFVTTASFAWTPDIGSSGLSGLFYIDGRMTGDYNTGSDIFPEKTQDGYDVWNARIGIRGPEQRWAVEFWGQNIFNAKYTQVAFNSPLQGSGSIAQVQAFGAPTSPTAPNFAAGNQLFSAYLAEPRTYGITIRGKF
ncbi:TonB-dependent receptor [Sphingobium fluviale]|uniref:TonB-dependent receptor n=1 Tax=Sphingobium fluviale TaxID=2506423 RepID=A0A4Q1KF35_9SPHN|nr:TonB-dependent receptor [Sphingobium fluviale]RXR25938.1 TonB-dependent receptor [Sphingobium fluviale]